MIIDSQMELSDAQAVTSTGDTASTNAYDAGVAQDSAVGEPIMVDVRVETTATSGGSATVQAVLQTSADNSTFTDLMAGAEFAVADVTQGTSLLRGVAPHGMKRYSRVVYRIGTAALTAGKFNANFVKDVDAQTAHASGFAV